MRALVLFFLPLLAQAFTLADTEKGFDKNEIDIYIANTDCSNAGFSTQRLKDLAEDAVDDYWNQVASADLKLKVKDVGDIDIDGLSFDDIFAAGLIPANSILAGCSDDPFAAGSGTLGATLMRCEGDTCRSVFIINARADSLVSTIDTDEKISTIAHELGHAIGLGHSEYNFNLMYYKIGGKTQKFLGQDDIDGVTYLYPYEAPGGCAFPLFGSMGTIKDISKSKNGKFPPHVLYILLGALITALFPLSAKVSKIFTKMGAS